MEITKLYRVDNDLSTEFFDNLYISDYNIEKETEKGYWINVYDKRKFVLKGNEGKRFAYISKEYALKGFIKRKERQISINKCYIERAKLGIVLAEKLINKN